MVAYKMLFNIFAGHYNAEMPSFAYVNTLSSMNLHSFLFPAASQDGIMIS